MGRRLRFNLNTTNCRRGVRVSSIKIRVGSRKMDGDSSSSHSITYAGPTRISTFSFGGRALRLIRPADPDGLLEEPGVIARNRHDDYMPYWAYVWPGAYFL